MTQDDLVERVRAFFDGDPRVVDKRAFGGTMFLLNGNMVVAVMKKGGLLVHVAREDVEAGLTREGASQMVHAGRTMTGFLVVAPYALETREQIDDWLAFSSASTAKLPPKDKTASATPKRRRTSK